MLDSLMAEYPALRSLQSRVARMLYRSGVLANQATIIGGILGVTAGVLFAREKLALGLLALGLSGILDAVDGTLARESGAATALGGVLDLTFDRIVEAAVLLGLIWPHSWLQLPAAVVLATWYVNITIFMATGAALGASEKLIHYPPGLVERTEALIFFVLLAAAPVWSVYLCYTYAGLEVATIVQRVSYALRYLGVSSAKRM
ncbi:MAG: CDP-alcohol phosphatidyltransferase family protein [Deltaproteobacteria bacterium]|nr:CDP-alcohol phosphatidyltransferase family protein [Deltaproteobacteria bacterium]